jgi:FkbM family methyltransferase
VHLVLLRWLSKASPEDPKVKPWLRSQHGEDAFILGLANARCARFVVDVGANDGQSWSNSFLFRKLGYRLLLIEPMPTYAGQCRQLYQDDDKVQIVEAAISREPGEAAFFVNLDRDNDLLAMRSSLEREMVPSGRVEEIRVRTAPLSEILEAAGCPEDYFLLSIDAEGVDPLVLETAALDRFRPHVICVEEQIYGELIPNWLGERGYERLAMLGPNGIYRRRGGALRVGRRPDRRS